MDTLCAGYLPDEMYSPFEPKDNCYPSPPGDESISAIEQHSRSHRITPVN